MSDKENTRSDCAVRIAVRERPFSSNELQTDVPNGIERYSEENIIIVDDRPFGFDHVFGQTSTQKEVFEAIGRPLVDKMLAGFNCSLLAYGQSGNGKTYTMGLDGQSEIGNSARDAGIIIRTLRSIFDAVEGSDSISDLKLEVSFIEIYNERVYDLLSPTYTEAEKFKKLFTKREMRTEADAKEILAEAYQKRHVRPTKINLTSSRSHAVFTIYATIQSSAYCSIHSELNLVDLAGAEGLRKTGHHGQALMEGVNINQGLLSVGRILQAIAKGDKVIPYRESVLTRVLQESLNRNCFLTLLACVSPSKLDTKETLSTLRFAENVGTLKNNPKINVIMNEIQMARRKTPTKQMFTPGRANSTFRTANRSTMNPNVNNTLKKKRLNFPPESRLKVTSTAKQVVASSNPVQSLRQPLSLLPPSEDAASIAARRPTEQDFSFATANISTSTFIHQPMIMDQTTTSSYSPVIRQCMSTFESRLEERINAAVNDIAGKLMGNSMVVGNGTFVAGKRRETTGDEDTGEVKRRRTRGSYRVDDGEEVTFKVPIRMEVRDQEEEKEKETPLDNTFDLSQDVFMAVGETTMLLRRSRRVQALNESRAMVVMEEVKKEEELKSKKRKRNPSFVKNQYLASYFRLSTQMEEREDEEEEKESETTVEKGKRKGRKGRKGGNVAAQNTHSTEVLKILNNGNLRELQILPQVGLKTAYQIMTYRATKGKFKKFADLKKLNWTEKKVERFMKDNYVS